MEKAHRKFDKCVKKFFDEEYLAIGLIHSVDKIHNQICLNIDGEIVRFNSVFDVSDLNPKDKIKFKYKINANDKFLLFEPEIIFFSLKQDFDLNEKQFARYALQKNKLSRIFVQNHSALVSSNLIIEKIPQTIYKIGIIVINSHIDILNEFKTKFKSKCVGKLFIYNLRDDNIAKDYANAINYFNKYHEIDLVCVLTARLKSEHFLALSSKYVLNNSAHKAYTICVGSNDYLASYIANQRNLTVNSVIDYIYQKQITHQNKLNIAINNGIKLLQNRINFYDAHLFNLELKINLLSKTKALNKIKKPVLKLANPFEILKKKILHWLEDELAKITEIEHNVNSIICGEMK